MNSYSPEEIITKVAQAFNLPKEIFLNSFLDACLPNRLSVEEGEIWDKKGYKTGQIDTIITRDDCPSLRFGRENEHINAYLAEGIFAVIEVKSRLNKEKLIESGNKLIEVSNLKVDFGITMKVGLQCDRSLRLVFAYEGATWKTIENEIIRRNWESLFDLICILNRGALINAFEDKKVNRLFKDVKNESPFLTASGKASSLGFLYYFLINMEQLFWQEP